MNGTKVYSRYVWHLSKGCGRVASLVNRSLHASVGGLLGNENPGVSNIKLCENHNRRKNKVSCTMIINAGLAGPKLRPNWSVCE